MDFFDHQEQARKRTSLLIVYYVVAVVLIFLSIYTVIAVLFTTMGGGEEQEAIPLSETLWNPELMLFVGLGTLLVVCGGTFYKVAQLSEGGKAVARMLGGRLIPRNSTRADERKVLNVVEEMAIASGTPVPPVYMMDQEAGVNAFAAGFKPSDAVIGVTKGCVAQLSRDELQGVIAHEFSHILNGDMRLNIRLIGVLNGILIIALIGYGIMRGSAGARVSRSSRDKGGGAIVLAGLALMVIGYVGVFFGKLIKSAVSRQREFLADASAVQFTRNPAGLAGALNRIGALARGSRMESPHAEEASHFFFANGLSSSLMGLMATHPPLNERIRRIDASVVGTAPKARHQPAPPPPPPADEDDFSVLGAAVSGFAVQADEVVAQVGTPRLEHLAYATQLLAGLPSLLTEAVRDPAGARAVIYSLLLDPDETIRAAQLNVLKSQAEAAVWDWVARVIPALDGLGHEGRLPLADMCVSTLKELTESDYRVFRDLLSALVAADEQVDLFEFTLQRMVLRHLEPFFTPRRTKAPRYHKLADVLAHVGPLLSCLAYWGTEDVADAQAAFSGASARLGQGVLTLIPVEGCGLQTVDDALSKLTQATAPVQRQVIDACTTCVGHDGWVTVEEADLLRAIADALDCPIPPFLPGKVAA